MANNKPVIDRHLSGGKLKRNLRWVQRGLEDDNESTETTSDTEKSGGEKKELGDTDETNHKEGEDDGNHSTSAPEEETGPGPSPTPTPTPTPSHNCLSTTCVECNNDLECVWISGSQSCVSDPISGKIGRSCPENATKKSGDNSKSFHIVGYISILLMFVGIIIFRRSARKRGSLSAESPIQHYTSLDQQNDEWDNWEEEGPRMESGMKTTSSGLQMLTKSHSRGLSTSKVGELGETEVNRASNGTSKSPSGQDDTYIKHPVSDDLFSELGIQAKPTFNKHTTRVVHTVGRWEPDGELQEPSGWDEDSLDI